MISKSLILLFLIFCASKVFAWSGGASAGTCISMTPNHRTDPQIGPPPATLILPEKIISGSQISVKIKSYPDYQFRGFKILARDNQNNIVGRFVQTDNANLIACGNMERSAASQADGNDKKEVELLWEAPLTSEPIYFNFIVTIVETFPIFWVNHHVAAIVVPGDDVPVVTDPPQPTIPPENDDVINRIYEGCDVTKSCFGIPRLCHLNRNCNMFGAVTYNEYNFTFELLSIPTTANNAYIAMGLSLNNRMGDSSVIECVRRQTVVSSHTSWTEGIEGANRIDDQDIISYDESSIIDGRLYCKVHRVAHSVVHGVTFDLVNEKYYLLLASGTTVLENSIGHHFQNQGYSEIPVLLTIPQIVDVDTSQNPLLLTHGALMFIAWIGLSSIGIVIARYYKKAWPNAKLFGKDLWFVWHVTCMFLTWLFTIIGFILIFVYRGEWRTSAHAIMGCVVLFFTIIQPIGALFRPDPKDDSRPLFNWLHKAFGSITHLLAIITIFFAVRFPNAGLPSYTLYILAAFVSFYLLMHIILTSINLCGLMKPEDKLNEFKKMPYSVLMKTLLGFFVTVIIVFTVMLLLVFMLDFE